MIMKQKRSYETVIVQYCFLFYCIWFGDKKQIQVTSRKETIIGANLDETFNRLSISVGYLISAWLL